jgi:hypothetical protein
MKKTILILTVLLIAIKTFAQTVSYPDIDRKGEKDVYIKTVSTTDYYTQINFVYKNTKSEGHYILLNLPGHKDAYYIKANGQTYKLLSTQNIGNTNGITAAMPGELVEFSARFERLPSYTTQIDLIEGTSGTWDFYGVKLKKVETTNSSPEKFRVDYNYVAAYDPNTETWGEWQAGDNTFVININEKGDIAHLKGNGETVIYKKLSGVEEGYTDKGNHHYQIIKALDEDGDVFRFQIFDDTSIGLKMMWGSFMIQFVKM